MFAKLRQGSAGSTAILVLIAAAIPTIVFAVLYFQIQSTSDADQQRNNELIRDLTMGKGAVDNKLAEEFTDADEDLVADAPTDASAIINPDVIYFSWVPDETPENEASGFADLITHLERETGRDFEMSFPASREDQLLKVYDGELHVTAFNTGGVPRAVNAAGFVPLVTTGRDGEIALYRSVLIADPDGASKIETPADLRGVEVLFTTADSNSGHKSPITQLEEDYKLIAGLDYEPRYSGGHFDSIELLTGSNEGNNRTYEVIAVASDILERAEARGMIDPSKYTEVMQSNDFPPAAVGVCHQLDPELVADIKKALLSFNFDATTMADYFAEESDAGPNQFIAIDDGDNSYNTLWSHVRSIDGARGVKHVLPARPKPVEPLTEEQAAAIEEAEAEAEGDAQDGEARDGADDGAE